MRIPQSVRLACFLATCLAAIVATADEHQKDSPWRKMFDGKSLEGWNGNEKMFRLEEGAVVAGTLEAKIPHNEFLCTNDEYGDFELKLKVKLIGEGDNAGVQFRSKRIKDHHEVIGYQADVGQAWDRPVWGALYDESRRRKMLAEPKADFVKKLVKQKDWNELRILCVGPRILIWLNGKQTVDYTEKEPAEKIARRGVIGLQIHGGPPAEAWYKDVMIRNLDKAPPTSQSTSP